MASNRVSVTPSASVPVFNTVDASASGGGSISPSGDILIAAGQNATFTLAPQAGYTVEAVTGCPGTLAGSTYTTEPITADCSVSAQFMLIPAYYTVTASASVGGSISPSGDVSIAQDQSTLFELAPQEGYTVDAVTGSCSGTLDGSTYTTGPIIADCSVSAQFSFIVAPFAPQITGIDYGDGEIYISVSAADDGGSPITGYGATCTDGVTEYTGISSTSPITVSGLTNGASYTCSVTATNAVGTSAASVSSAPVMPVGPPDAPTIDSIAPGSLGASVTFTPGANNGSPISGYRFIKDDGTVDSGILGTTDRNPYGIAMDTVGNIYTANYGSDTVSKITPAGASTTLGVTGSKPYAIAIDAAGNIYTANQSSDTVSKITPAGVSTILATTGSSPSAIAIDAVGNVYTANQGSDTVSKITPEGTSTLFGATGSGPRAIALDDVGNVYTANRGSNTVSKIAPDGTSIMLGTTGTQPFGIAIDTFGNIYTSNQLEYCVEDHPRRHLSHPWNNRDPTVWDRN